MTFTARSGCYRRAAGTRRRRHCRAPSAKKYRKAFLAFDKTYPCVKTYSAWNEINHKSQPTFKSPRKAAGYYNVLRKYTRKKKFRAMAADMLDTPNMSRYLSSFKRYAKGSPKLWGLHNYGDVNRKRTSYTKLMLRSVPGEVWLTETGGIVKLLPSFKRNTKRAASRTKGLFRLVEPLRHQAERESLEDHAAVRLHVVRREQQRPLRRRPRQPRRVPASGVQGVQEERAQAPLAAFVARVPAGSVSPAGAPARGIPCDHQAPMDLCLMIEGQEGVSWEDWLALAKACEAHGVPGLFRSDHYLNLDGRADRGSLDAWATISALAAVTDTLRLGTLVSPATFRHPSELAKVVVTADHVSGGRVELGLGAGWHEPEHRAYGFPFPPLRERMDRLAEQLEIVHGSWTSKSSYTFDGAHYSLEGLDAQPRPVQQPHPPLIMGGNAGPRGAALAARWADEYNTPFATLEQIRERKARVDAACRDAGREPIPFSLMTGFLVGLDREELREKAAALAIAQGDEGRDVDAWIASPPDAWIVGTVDEVVEQLGVLRDAGLARVMLQHLLHTDLETVELIGRKLAPAVA